MFINEKEAFEVAHSNLDEYKKLEKIYQLLKPDIDYMLKEGVSITAILYFLSKYFNLDIKLFDLYNLEERR